MSRASTKVSVTGGEPTLDNVNVATLAGDDTATAGVDFTGSTPVSVIGGEGSDTINYNGSSIKTVETHLAAGYRKLGVNTRADLAAQLAG